MYKRLAIFSHSIISLLLLSTFIVIGQEARPDKRHPQLRSIRSYSMSTPGQYEDAQNLAGVVFSFFREGDKFYVRVTNQEKIEVFSSIGIKIFS